MVMFALLAALPWILVIAFQFGPNTNRGSGNGLRISDLATEGGLELRRVRPVGVGELPADGRGGAVLRRHRGQRGQLVVAALSAGRADPARPAAAPEADRRAHLFGRRRDGGAGDGGGGRHDRVRLARHPGCPAPARLIPAADVLPKFGIVILYAMVSNLVVASLAFLLSVSTDSPLGAVGGAVGLVIVSTILQAVEALGRPAGVPADLLEHRLARRPGPGARLQRHDQGAGGGGDLRRAVLLAFAFRRFRRKDVVS